MPALVEAGATAVELMVNPTLIAASYSLPGIPEEWREIPPEGAVLLVELRTDDPSQLDGLEQRALAAVEGHELLEAAAFTGVPEEIEVFWLVREGMQGIVGAMRPQGTSLIIEDVCVRPERIAECARDVQALLGKYEFLTGVAGHASAGNLHFLLTPGAGRARRPRPLRGLHGRAGGADRGQVRRLAEGRARHRAQHGALRGARVGRAGHRADVAREAPGRSRTACSTPARC